METQPIYEESTFQPSQAMNVQPTRVSSSDSISGVQSQTNDQESISIKNVQPSRVDSTDVPRMNVLLREMKTQPSLKLACHPINTIFTS